MLLPLHGIYIRQVRANNQRLLPRVLPIATILRPSISTMATPCESNTSATKTSLHTSETSDASMLDILSTEAIPAEIYCSGNSNSSKDCANSEAEELRETELGIILPREHSSNGSKAIQLPTTPPNLRIGLEGTDLIALVEKAPAGSMNNSVTAASNDFKGSGSGNDNTPAKEDGPTDIVTLMAKRFITMQHYGGEKFLLPWDLCQTLKVCYSSSFINMAAYLV